MSSLVHISISYLLAYTFVELLSSSIPFSSRFVVISFFASLFNIFLIFFFFSSPIAMGWQLFTHLCVEEDHITHFNFL